MCEFLRVSGDGVVVAPFARHKSGFRCLGVEIQEAEDDLAEPFGRRIYTIWRAVGADDPETRADDPVVVLGIQAVAWLAWDAVKGEDIKKTVTMTLDDRGLPIRVEEDWDLVPADILPADDAVMTRRRLSGTVTTRITYSRLEYASKGLRLEDESILDIIAELEERGLIGYINTVI